MKIFIGSSKRNIVEERVLIYTILKNTSVKIQDIYILDASSLAIRDFSGNVVANIPSHLGGSTSFSWSRFLIPEFCEFKGVAVYLDSDIVVNGSLDFLEKAVGTFDFACVPVHEATSKGIYKKRILAGGAIKELANPFLTSVMVINCERLRDRFTFKKLKDLYDSKKLSYSDIMFFSKQFLTNTGLSVNALPPQWNCLDCWPADAEIVHFTELETQPWFSVFNPAGQKWYNVFKSASDEGFVRNVDLEQAFSEGVITRRVMLMPYLKQARRNYLKLGYYTVVDYFRETPKFLLIVAKANLKNFVSAARR